MRKKNIILLTLFFICIFFAPKTNAQQPTPTPNSNAWSFKCLNPEWCHPDENRGNSCAVKHWHRVKLTSSPANKPPVTAAGQVYLIECINVLYNGQIQQFCTTGDEARDMEAGLVTDNDSNLRFLAQRIEYSVTKEGGYGIYGPDGRTLLNKNSVEVTSNGLSIPSLEWQSFTDNAYHRRFGVLTRVPPTQVPPQITDTGLKQAVLSFANTCGSEQYDPLGYAYDINTGNPVPGVNIEIDYKKTQSDLFRRLGESDQGLGVDKILPPGSLPVRTNDSGYYQFFGQSGYYKMIASSEFAHLQAVESANIPSKIKRLYYEAKNYYLDQEFYEGREVKKLNIPLNVSPSQINPFVFSVTSVSQIPKGKNLEVKVTTNGPANILISQCETESGVKNCEPNTQFLTALTRGPNPENNFTSTVLLPNSSLKLGYSYDFEVTSYDINQDPQPRSLLDKFIRLVKNIFSPTVFASGAKVSFQIEPIPSYLEGYLYSATGEVLRNTVVEVHIQSLNSPYYSFTTDENGFFRVTSEHLPQMTYNLKYKNPTTSEYAVLTTSDLLSQNKEFLTSENVDVYSNVTEVSNTRANVTPMFTPRVSKATSPIKADSKNNEVVAVSPVSQSNPASSNYTVVAVIALFLLLLAVVASIIIIRKKRLNNENDNNV